MRMKRKLMDLIFPTRYALIYHNVAAKYLFGEIKIIVRDLRNRLACMKRVVKFEEVAKVCKDHDV